MLDKQWEQIFQKLQFIEGGTKQTSFGILVKLPGVMESMSKAEHVITKREFKELEEFVFNSYRLAAQMAKQPDAKIEDYHCKDGCKHKSEVVCPGEYFYIINSKSKSPCPCYNLSQDAIENLAKELDKHPLG